MNSDWSLRLPTHAELLAAFGTMRAARDKTGGDHVTACFLIANPDKIAAAPTQRKVTGQWADELDRAAQDEEYRERAGKLLDREYAAIEAFKQTGTIKAAMRAGNFGFKRAKRLCKASA